MTGFGPSGSARASAEFEMPRGERCDAKRLDSALVVVLLAPGREEEASEAMTEVSCLG